MSTLKLDRARTRFHKAMPIAPPERFLLMLWAVEALRSGRPDIARQFIRFTPEQAKQAVGDTHAIFPWELETLAIQSLTIPREVINRIYRCEDFAMADADPDISAADRRPIAFVAIQDFEQLLSQSDEAGVRAALAVAHQDRFRGWVMPGVDKELHGTGRKRKR